MLSCGLIADNHHLTPPEPERSTAIPALLQAREFRSKNQLHQSVVRALDVVKQTVEHAPRFYDPKEVPLEGIGSSGWRNLIFTPDKQGHLRVDRLKYELCVLQALRERLRCKEIWVVGAIRYRNPEEEDLPTDFEVQREQYYAAPASRWRPRTSSPA